MNWVDLLIILTVITFALEGLKRGFFVQVIEIIGFLISLLAALNLYSFAAQLLTQYFKLPKITASPIGFLLVWIIAEGLFFTFFNVFFGKLLQLVNKNSINKYFGFIPATINSLLFLAFILLFVVSLPVRPDIKKDIFDSQLGSRLVSSASSLEKPLSSIFGPIAKQSLTFLTVKPEEKGSIPLEFTQKELTLDYVSEQKMLELVNQERSKYGIEPLVWDEARAQVGRNHSKDMFERGYFSHYSPEGEDVGDRLEEANIGFSLAGENLALAPDVTRAHTGLMNSEGHRRNILDPAFKKIGIGAADGGIYGKMFTQILTD